MSLLTEKLEKKFKGWEDWLRINIQDRFMGHGPADILRKCDKCGHYNLVQIGHVNGVEAVVRYVLELAKESEMFRFALLNRMSEEIEKSEVEQ